MKPVYREGLTGRARELRKNATRHENHLWYDFLRNYPVKFQRQRPICGFIADFYCAAAFLAVELDGSQHYEDQGQAYDTERSAVLAREGVTVLRFSNADIDRNFRGVCETIDRAVKERLNGETQRPPQAPSVKGTVRFVTARNETPSVSGKAAATSPKGEA